MVDDMSSGTMAGLVASDTVARLVHRWDVWWHDCTYGGTCGDTDGMCGGTITDGTFGGTEGSCPILPWPYPGLALP